MNPNGLLEEKLHSFLNFGARLEVTGYHDVKVA